MDSIFVEEATEGPTGNEERIVVSVRMRPLNDKELTRNDVSEWECINDTTIIYKNNLSASERSLYPTAYSFDRVFSDDCSTRQVYEEAAKEVALSVLNGINSSIFAYGQTSSGKTYTMGGITEYTVADIFNYIEKHKERDFVLKFSALEIYNESVRDLLCADSTPLRLLDDPERGTVVERLTEETLHDWNQFTELISFCETQRQIGETSLNEASSRSHQIFRLSIESFAREFLGNDTSSSLAASVNFVDLAGSERASQTNSAGTRLKEGSHINRSLLTLGTVIRKLSKGRNGHIPFRDSKLTRILQSSLGGNGRTAIICTMSPARSHVEQSRNTLLFASSARQITTNAQVNVVMSDKVLVKQLQRELARLETEMRNSWSSRHKSDSSKLLKEKELEIEMLKKEVSNLTLQRDLAQSQIKDMLQVVGDDLSSTELESLDPQYPKLRVRSSWDFENQTEEPSLLSFDGLDSIKSFDASLYSDGHSISSDDNFFQLPDLEKNLPFRSPSPVANLDAERNDSDQKENIEEKHDKNIGDQEITNTCTNSNPPNLNPNSYTDSNASSPKAYTAVSGLLEDVDGTNKRNPEFPPSGLKKNKVLNSFQQDFTFLSQQKMCPWPSEISASCSRSVKLVRSISCKASLMRDSSPDWFDEEEIIQSTPPIKIEKDFAERLVGFQRKLYTLNYNKPNAERLSWSGFGNPMGRTDVELLNVNSASSDKESDCNCAFTPERIENIDLGSSNLLANHEVLETGLQSISAKKFKDVGLDPMQSDEEKHSDWPSEFKRLQREIVQLWHACNVSLVHRSYFFLLFKGDTSDSIYMEVELRRLSYLKETFSQGNKTVEDRKTLTPESSIRSLRKERQMLSKRMLKRLSRSERNKVYMSWGIDKSSKHRRLQLAHCLWSDTEDMDRIRESATIVAKLVGSVEPDQAFKEMFGLNFTPRHKNRKSFGWTATMRRITS